MNDLASLTASGSREKYGDNERKYNEIAELLKHTGQDNANNSYLNILQFVKPESKILEFGPASGYMTRYLRNNLDCDVTIVELDPECALIASSYSTRSFVGDIDEGGWVEWLGNSEFDYIIFADVLEHLKLPWKTLEKAKRFLCPGGSILCSIPNTAHHTIIAELMGNQFIYGESGLLDITHIRFFTSKSIEKMVGELGLSIVGVNNTALEEVYVNGSYPWISGTLPAFLVLLRDRLAGKPQHAALQYVFELKNTAWVERNNIPQVGLCPEESFLEENDLLPFLAAFKEERDRNELLTLEVSERDRQVKEWERRFSRMQACWVMAFYNLLIRILACFILKKNARKSFRNARKF